MQRGLELIDGAADGAKTSGDDPVVIKSEDSITLILSMGGGIWKPQYVFSLVPIAIDAVAILEAKVRDLEESNRELMQFNEASANRIYTTLFSGVSTPSGADFNWSAEHLLRHLPPDFSLSEDGKVVTAELAALYELHVEVTCRHSSNSKTLEIILNDEAVAECWSSNSSNHYGNVNVQLILRLNKKDKIRVMYYGSQPTYSSSNTNRFSLLRIGS